MNEQTALPAWLIFLLITLGVMIAVGAALLLTQLDSLQQRSLLPQEELPVVDQQATISAGELTVVVIVPDETAVSSIVTATTETANPTAVGETPRPTATQVLVPTCIFAPESWEAIRTAPGDSLSDVAERFGTTVELLARANCLDVESFVSGQTLFVPGPSSGAGERAEDCPGPEGWSGYLVRDGDTLADLAHQRATTVEEIMAANCLEDLELAVGLQILLPPLATPLPQASPTQMMPQRPGGPVMPPMKRPTPIVRPRWPSPTPKPQVTRWWPTATPWTAVTRWPTPTKPFLTATSLPSPTVTHTPQPAPSVTNVPDVVPSSTATGVPTSTATARPTSTVTATASATLTATAMPTITASPSPSPSATITSTVTVTMTSTPTPSLTPTGTLLAPTSTSLPPGYPYP